VRFEDLSDDSTTESDDTSSDSSSAVDELDFGTFSDDDEQISSPSAVKASFNRDVINFLPFIFVLPWLLIRLL
jgi:hypothetical protein